MNRRMIWLSIFALGFTMLAADVIVAQEKGRERGKRGQRGRGGPGGFGGFGGGGFTPISLLGNSAVQKELGLNESQTAEAEKLSDAYREESRSGPRFDFRALQDLSEEERRQKLEEYRQQREEQQKKLNAKYDPKIASLLDPGQADRLDQILLQLKGVGAFQEEATAKSLGISKEQQDKIASINSDFESKQRELFRDRSGGQEGFQERFAKMRELGEKRDADVLAVLSTDQKQKYAAMKGREIDRQAIFGGFGRGRGGDRGRDGQGRGGDRGKRGKRPPM